jgi:predicted dienelactone hydrolase
VHDGIHLELGGRPAGVICTDGFLATARAMAQVWGAERFPIALMPHPLSSRTETELAEIGARLAPRLAEALTAGGR